MLEICVWFLSQGKVTIKPGSLKYRADLLSQLARFGLPVDGTVPVLRKRLNTDLQTLAPEFGNSKLVQVRPPLEKLTSICAASEHILLYNAQRGIIQVTLHYNGVGIAGTGVKFVTYPTGISNAISMEVLTQSLLCSRSGRLQPFKLRS